MPNSVEDFVPHKLLTLVVAQLQTITLAAGYNTEPKVDTHPSRFRDKASQHNVLVTMGPLTPGDRHTTGRGDWTQVLDIVGMTIGKTGDPVTENNKLKQDVLTCLTTWVGGLTAALGRGVVVEFETVETDDDARVIADGLISFVVPVSFMFSQTPPW